MTITASSHWAKVILALLPMLVGALTFLAWENSLNMTRLVLKQDRSDDELKHLRELIEQRLVTCK